MFDQLIIFCGGYGSRLRPLTLDKPKPLVDLGDGNTVVNRIIDSAHAQGITSFLLLTGYLSESFQETISHYSSRSHIHVVAHSTPPSFTTNQRLIAAKHLIKENPIILYGDNIFEPSYELLFNLWQNTNEPISLAAPVRPGKLGNIQFIGNSRGSLYRSIRTDSSAALTHTDIGFFCQTKDTLLGLATSSPDLSYQSTFFDIEKRFTFKEEWPYHTLTDIQSYNNTKQAITEKVTLLLDRDGVLVSPRAKGKYDNESIASQHNETLFNVLTSSKHHIERIILITNQPWISNSDADSIRNYRMHNHKLLDRLKSQVECDIFYFECPHPFTANCSCRKPLPGLLYQSAQQIRYLRSKAIFLGDSPTDSLAASKAGIDFSYYDVESRISPSAFDAFLKSKTNPDYWNHRFCRFAYS